MTTPLDTPDYSATPAFIRLFVINPILLTPGQLVLTPAPISQFSSLEVSLLAGGTGNGAVSLTQYDENSNPTKQEDFSLYSNAHGAPVVVRVPVVGVYFGVTNTSSVVSVQVATYGTTRPLDRVRINGASGLRTWSITSAIANNAKVLLTGNAIGLDDPTAYGCEVQVDYCLTGSAGGGGSVAPFWRTVLPGSATIDTVFNASAVAFSSGSGGVISSLGGTPVPLGTSAVGLWNVAGAPLASQTFTLSLTPAWT